MNKISYMNARKTWTENYKAHSAKTRELKQLYKAAQREFSTANSSNHLVLWRKMEGMRQELLKAKVVSREWLDMLKDLKKEAQESYQDELAQRSQHCAQ